MVDIVRELSRSYVQTYIQIALKSTPEKRDVVWLRQLERVSDEHDDFITSVQFADSSNTIHADSKKFLFFFDYPTPRVVNHMNGVVIHQRRPERQWQKGLCTQNSYVFQPLSGYFKTLLDLGFSIPEAQIHQIKELVRPDLNRQLALSIFNSPEFSFAQAQELIQSGQRFAAAFHPEFWLSLSTNANKKLLIWKNSVVIGEFLAPYEIQAHPMFYQELLDLVRRKKLPFLSVKEK